MTTTKIETGEDIQCGWTAPSGDICESVSWAVLRFKDDDYILCLDCGNDRKVTIEPAPPPLGVTTPKLEATGVHDLECGGLDNDGAQCANVLWTISVFADGAYMICSDCGNSGKIVVPPVECARCGQPVSAECAKRFVEADGHAVVLHGEPDRPCYDMAVAGADLSACFDCWDAELKDYGCKWETNECPCDCHGSHAERFLLNKAVFLSGIIRASIRTATPLLPASHHRIAH